MVEEKIKEEICEEDFGIADMNCKTVEDQICEIVDGGEKCEKVCNLEVCTEKICNNVTEIIDQRSSEEICKTVQEEICNEIIPTYGQKCYTGTFINHVDTISEVLFFKFLATFK